MTRPLRPGDRVTWQHVTRCTSMAPKWLTGSVCSLHGSRVPWATVISHSGGNYSGYWIVALERLTRLEREGEGQP